MRDELWKQFGASIETLEEVIKLCPEQFWNTDENIWYDAYHCIFYLDYYLTLDPVHFNPPAPFDDSHFEAIRPDLVYSRNDLLDYINYCRKKCHTLFQKPDTAFFSERWINSSGTMNYSLFEICLYNMRHVQHHAAQLNMLLRKMTDSAADWISRTDIKW